MAGHIPDRHKGRRDCRQIHRTSRISRCNPDYECTHGTHSHCCIHGIVEIEFDRFTHEINLSFLRELTVSHLSTQRNPILVKVIHIRALQAIFENFATTVRHVTHLNPCSYPSLSRIAVPRGRFYSGWRRAKEGMALLLPISRAILFIVLPFTSPQVVSSQVVPAIEHLADIPTIRFKFQFAGKKFFNVPSLAWAHENLCLFNDFEDIYSLDVKDGTVHKFAPVDQRSEPVDRALYQPTGIFYDSTSGNLFVANYLKKALCRLEWVNERSSSSPTPQPACGLA